MVLEWYRRDQKAVAEALRRGEPPEMATTMASGPLDELVALHDELGVFSGLDSMWVERQRGGVDDRLLLRTLAVLPFLEAASLTAAAGLLFRDPAVLLHLGWSALQIQRGDNERYRGRQGRQAVSLPCSPETLRDELGRVSETEWLRIQQQAVQQLFEKRLVRGTHYAIDGTGLGPGLRLVCLVCVSDERPKIVAWRLLQGAASEKGKEAVVTRGLIEQLLEIGGKNSMDLLLVDALYADGPLLAWCKCQHGIDVLVPIPKEREIHRDLEQLAAGATAMCEPSRVTSNAGPLIWASSKASPAGTATVRPHETMEQLNPNSGLAWSGQSMRPTKMTGLGRWSAPGPGRAAPPPSRRSVRVGTSRTTPTAN